MPGQLSDLVEDARLDTIFQLDLTTHTYHDSDPLAGQRTILRKEHWRRKKRLGVGGFGTVWLEECDDANKSGKLRAVKEIKRPKNLVEYDRELETLLKFSHRRYSRCFVRMSGWYHDDESIFIAMDYFPHGDLETYIRDSEGPLPEQEARDIVFQTLEGLAFMHRNRFAHRDLKPANILIQSQPPQDWWVKLTDFGLSKYIQDSQASFSHRGGTTSYMAPERHGFYASGHESSRRLPLAGDMWSLGEISHVMMTKRHIFESIYDVFQFTENGQKLPDLALRESKATLEAISFIRAVMMPAPEDRLTAEVARRHPWMSNITLSTHKSRRV
ncbi:kinase-like domain-containing protein [Clohesyomyces aquaticus]|uniref:non-specific serine/threonine protein kinase n=1 Tax=Clohesyomyces aquaticus TaxID=1231657 RepID=A0A1Y1YQW3_9PLEO|nr:kinase-like domain-containing protein [Clohesyomyces aquaticus]